MFKVLREKINIKFEYSHKINNFKIDTPCFSIYFDGLLFDLDGFESEEEYLKSLSEDSKDFTKILASLNGIFRLIIHSKEEKKVVLVADHLASKKIFYSDDLESTFVTGNLFDFENLEQSKLSTENVCFFIGFGFYENGCTPFENIKQVKPGEYVEVCLETNDVKSTKYHSFKDDKCTDRPYPETLKLMNDYLVSSIKRVKDLNRKYGYPMSSSLSGGLDAKTVVVMLNKLFPNESLNTVTFAQTGSSDDKIASRVSSYYKNSHIFQSLDSAEHLYSNVENYIHETSGMIGAHGSLHSYNTYRKLNSSLFGFHLSGQIGDVIFGSAIKDGFDLRSDYQAISYCGSIPKYLGDKILSESSIFSDYENTTFEVFNIEQRQSNGTLNGDRCVESMFETVSPFYNKKLIELSLSIPNEMRMHEKLYIDFLKTYAPDVTKFPWDKSDCRPTGYYKTRIFKFLKLVGNGIRRRIGLKYDHMNPFDVWMKENPKISDFLDKEFKDNIKLLDFDEEMSSLVKRLYLEDTDKYKRRKFVIVTFLIFMKKISEKA